MITFTDTSLFHNCEVAETKNNFAHILFSSRNITDQQARTNKMADAVFPIVLLCKADFASNLLRHWPVNTCIWACTKVITYLGCSLRGTLAFPSPYKTLFIWCAQDPLLTRKMFSNCLMLVTLQTACIDWISCILFSILHRCLEHARL